MKFYNLEKIVNIMLINYELEEITDNVNITEYVKKLENVISQIEKIIDSDNFDMDLMDVEDVATIEAIETEIIGNYDFLEKLEIHLKEVKRCL